MKFVLAVLVLCVSRSVSQHCIGDGLYDAYFNKCYHLFTVPQVYAEAVHVCAAFNGRLVSIHNAFEDMLVYSNARQRFNDDYWIGLSDIEQKGVWKWSDGVQSNYTNWIPGYPSGDSLSCVAVRVSMGKWYNRDCDTAKKYFVCEVNADDDIPQGHCLSGGDYSEQFDRCFYFVNSVQNNVDATLTCGTLHGNLTSVNTAAKQAFVYEMAKKANLRGDYWIGLSDASDDGNWKWSDSSPYNYSNWDVDFPQIGFNQTCAVSELSKGKWFNTLCATRQNCFICETEPLPYVAPTAESEETTLTTASPGH